MNKALRYAGISGIFVVVLSFVSLGLFALRFVGVRSGETVMVGIIGNIVYLIFAIPFIYGFILLGEKTKNRILVYSSYLGLIVMVPSTLISLFFEFYPASELLIGILGIVISLLTGLVGLALGAGLMKLKKEFGNLATAAGILEICCSLLFLTIILYPLGAFIGTIAGILEVALLLKAAKKF
ncbi:MAG: hypothetical protein L6243_05335 [Candidatus Altiarchaeales archaeon]|nr:hypothetical protein [Candidatus Altiarchaeota archaeon]MBU4266340.1 hypothetical protein [Candidatus Altiarchaeota archaeon]MBU4341320.1 hypothetical protein [Candidatus Altiarchaeota archaeon]MBU4437858.1 hypothetical protein [Candidatus Altiarchaeota archaeon]MCG2782994.1 hypothetical protein [Candidatus Altiarchaeales archaeon]